MGYKNQIHKLQKEINELQKTNQINIIENYQPNEFTMSEVKCKSFYSKYKKDCLLIYPCHMKIFVQCLVFLYSNILISSYAAK